MKGASLSSPEGSRVAAYFLPSASRPTTSGLTPITIATIPTSPSIATTYGSQKSLMDLYSPPWWLEHHTGTTIFRDSSTVSDVDGGPLPPWIWSPDAAHLRQDVTATDYRLAAALRDVVQQGLGGLAPVHNLRESSPGPSSK